MSERKIICQCSVLLLLMIMTAVAFLGCGTENAAPAPGKDNEIIPPANGTEPNHTGVEGKPSQEPLRPEKPLQISLLSTIDLEPTAHQYRFSPDGCFFVYYQASQISLVRLSDLEGNEIILPPANTNLTKPHSRGGAVWHGNKLFYLVKLDAFNYDSKDGRFIYSYDTATGSLVSYPPFHGGYNSREPLLPKQNDEGLLFVSAEGVFEYQFGDHDWRKKAELPQGISKHFLVWSPSGDSLAYKDGNRILLIDVRSGKLMTLCQFEDEITEFSWSGDGASIALLVKKTAPESPYTLEIVSIAGNVLYSLAVTEKRAYALSWVPGKNMVSYRVADTWEEPSRMVVEVLEEGLRLVDQNAHVYSWVSGSKLLYYYGIPDATRLEFYGVSW